MSLQTEGQHDESSAAVEPPASFISTLKRWNNTQTEYPEHVCIHQLFEAQVELSPDATAVVFNGKQLTYQQLNQQANQLAHYLQTLGVKPETLIGIYVERSLEMVVGLLGILKAGGAYVPLNPGTPRERLSFILDETQVPIILTQARLLKDLPIHEETIVCLDADWQDIACNRDKNPVCETTSDNLIYVIYTSGSTGQPKGVMISHRGICNQLFWRQTTFPLTQSDRILQNISFSFDPSVWQIFWPLSFGAQLVLPNPGGQQDSAYLAQLIAQEQITVIALVPSMLRVFLEEKELEQCQCLKHVFCGGEALPGELQDQFYKRLQTAILHNVYGPTEASIDATFWTCQPGTNYQIAPIGRPIANTQIYILDATLQPVSIGEAGELYIGGDGLARGYLNRHELTTEKFIHHDILGVNDKLLETFHGQIETPPTKTLQKQTSRLYKTGDLACYLPNGDIQFLGRIDYQVKIRGFRIELGEIESVLNQHPSVKQSVVIAREDRPGDKRLAAYVVPVQEQATLTNELRSFLKEKLPEYMVPSSFVWLETLPLNSNGKVDRHALPAPDLERPAWAKPFVAPQTSIELKLCNAWAEVLGIESIGIEDNFFDLGGNSLLAARLLAKVEALYHKKLSLNTFLQAPTIKQLASILGGSQTVTGWKSIIPIQPSGSKPPLFCVHAKNGNVLQYYKLAHYLGNDQPFYGIQAQGIDDGCSPRKSVEEMAAAYIKELQQLQPCGPYFLSGYSFGGLVAYEMARLLHAKGHRVAKLILLDTYNARGDWFGPQQPRNQLSSYNGRFSQLRGLEKLANVKVVLQEAVLVRLRRFRRVLAYYLRSSFTPKESQDWNAVQEWCEIAAEKYRPKSYSGQANLVRATKAADESWLQPIETDSCLGWELLIKGGLEVQEINCHHFDLLLEPNVKILALQLKEYLTEV